MRYWLPLTIVVGLFGYQAAVRVASADPPGYCYDNIQATSNGCCGVEDDCGNCFGTHPTYYCNQSKFWQCVPQYTWSYPAEEGWWVQTTEQPCSKEFYCSPPTPCFGEACVRGAATGEESEGEFDQDNADGECP